MLAMIWWESVSERNAAQPQFDGECGLIQTFIHARPPLSMDLSGRSDHRMGHRVKLCIRFDIRQFFTLIWHVLLLS